MGTIEPIIGSIKDEIRSLILDLEKLSLALKTTDLSNKTTPINTTEEEIMCVLFTLKDVYSNIGTLVVGREGSKINLVVRVYLPQVKIGIGYFEDILESFLKREFEVNWTVRSSARTKINGIIIALHSIINKLD